MDFEKIWNEWDDSDEFSGVFSVIGEQGVIFEKCGGFRNRSEQLVNNRDTAFGIASGTKLFTGLAVCKLIDEKKLSLDDKIHDILPYDLGQIDKNVTVFHLLTHTSGIGDYIDEESDDSMEQLQALYDRYPVHLWDNLEFYLPMTAPLPPKFQPGERFGYSNSGFVLLGLVIETVSGVTYQQYVENTIIEPLNLKHTDFYRADSLPANTALGYMQDETSGEWRTNVFSLPIIGGSDGGIYTCAADLDKLWRGVFANKLLSEKMLNDFTACHAVIYEKNSYGLGVYRGERGGDTFYYAVGGDCGVDFFTAYFPKQQLTISALGNTEINTYPLLEAVTSIA